MHVLDDPGRGDWLHGRVGRTGREDWLVPGGYPAAVRVLHEPSLVRDHGDRDSSFRITWQQAATLLGRRVEEGMSWAMLTGSDDDRTPLGPGLDLVGPEEGHLPPAVLATILREATRATASTAGGTAAVWIGWAELQPGAFGFGVPGVPGDDPDRPSSEPPDAPLTDAQRAIRDGRTLELPHREYVLLDCDLAELLDPTWVRTAGLGWTQEADLPGSRGPATPNLLWPADRSWFLACEVDDPYTTLLGPEGLIDRLDRLPELETMRVPAPRRAG